MEKVLVTGAYGFLGKYLVKELVANGYQVVAFGRKEKELKKIEGEHVEICVGDFCNFHDILDGTKGVDYVIHAGAKSTVWGKRNDFIETNVEGTRNVVNACKENHVKRLIYVSSPSVYSGKEDRIQIKEDDYDIHNRLNYYIESKIMAETLIHEEWNYASVIIRPRGLIGIGDTSIIPRLIRANRKVGVPLFNHGNNYVDMTCVENVALALRLALVSDQALGNVYNITNGEPRKFQEILEELFRQIEEKPKYLKMSLNFMYGVACCIEAIYRFFHIYKEPMITKYNICTLGYSQTLDIEKAKKDLNYKPIITLKEGIQKYARDYKQNKIL